MPEPKKHVSTKNLAERRRELAVAPRVRTTKVLSAAVVCRLKLEANQKPLNEA